MDSAGASIALYYEFLWHFVVALHFDLLDCVGGVGFIFWADKRSAAGAQKISIAFDLSQIDDVGSGRGLLHGLSHPFLRVLFLVSFIIL